MIKNILKKMLGKINLNLEFLKLGFTISCALLAIIKYIKIIKENWLSDKPKKTENEMNIILPLLLFSVIKNTPIDKWVVKERDYNQGKRVHLPKGREGVIKPVLQKIVSLRDGNYFYLCLQTPFQEMLLAGIGGYAIAFGILAVPGSLEYVNAKANKTLVDLNKWVVKEKKKGGLFDFTWIMSKYTIYQC
jgi:hypothetical protein